ncbi:MAG: leucine--tRNA ligase, partial [Minisyncoccia bacterium]
ELGTVLANDEIIERDGKQVSERGEYPVEKMTIRQWSMRITAYAERLIKGLEDVDFPEHIKTIQNNWIGKSEGAEIDFTIQGSSEKITVFTTRADTLFGVSAVVLAPEHDFIEKNKTQIQNYNVVETYIRQVKNKANEERTENKEKSGVELKGIKAINPASGEPVSVWVADYVLTSYGAGAVMSVPAHDERDFEFAKKYKIDVKEVLKSSTEENTEIPFTGEGVLINSEKFTGMNSDVARGEITKSVGGRVITNYKMRDAIFARQRYWGEPIPLYRDKNGIIHEVKKLPLELPNVKSYEPTGKAEGPLAGVKAWTAKGYETNTMPGWAGSSWYFLRYMDPKNKKVLVGDKEIAYWKNVDVYVGGAEHVTGHLLYSRFWHKFLRDIGVVNTEEPFKKMYNQGLILASDGRKMSKRWGNVINPDDIIKTFGADTLRVYEMFMGPFTASQPWNTESIIGSRRFIERVWRLGMRVTTTENDFSGARISSRHFSPSAKIAQSDHSKSFSASATSENLLSAVVTTEITLHKTIKKVTEDIENFAFNTAISSLMICLNEFENAPVVSVDMYKIFLQLLAPFAPHITDEVWSILGEKKSIHNSMWPKHDPKKIVSNTVTIGIQVNGKIRAEITIPTNANQSDVEKMALQNEKVQAWLEGKEIKKIIYIPGRLINIAAV